MCIEKIQSRRFEGAQSSSMAGAHQICQWFKATRIKVRLQAVSLFLNANVEQRSRKTRETRAAAARAIFVPHVFSLDGLRNDFQCRVNFYVRTCVKFTFANKIDAMHER